MFIRLSRYIILGMIISLVAFLVTQNNQEKVKKETLLLIGVISAIIIFAISFRIEFYENTEEEEEVPDVLKKTDQLKYVEQRPLEEQHKGKVNPSTSETTDSGVSINQREKLRQMAIEMIRNMDITGTDDDEELMKKVEDALRMEINKPQIEVEMAEKILERVVNPKLTELTEEPELKYEGRPQENRLSLQYQAATEDVIKEKIREQLFSDKVVQRQKESDYVIMPVSDWSLPLEKRQHQCIPQEEKPLCECGPGEGSGFWEGSFLKLKGASDLPPMPKNKIENI